ncbi:hypothetical protein HDV05_006284 [Chytridiales sp. JEL 0842]|nr:hypothetical protein HDV05_006284 [Chytridiales sp. JEL 0842]
MSRSLFLNGNDAPSRPPHRTDSTSSRSSPAAPPSLAPPSLAPHLPRNTTPVSDPALPASVTSNPFFQLIDNLILSSALPIIHKPITTTLETKISKADHLLRLKSAAIYADRQLEPIHGPSISKLKDVVANKMRDLKTVEHLERTQRQKSLVGLESLGRECHESLKSLFEKQQVDLGTALVDAAMQGMEAKVEQMSSRIVRVCDETESMVTAARDTLGLDLKASTQAEMTQRLEAIAKNSLKEHREKLAEHWAEAAKSHDNILQETIELKQIEEELRKDVDQKLSLLVDMHKQSEKRLVKLGKNETKLGELLSESQRTASEVVDVLASVTAGGSQTDSSRHEWMWDEFQQFKQVIEVKETVMKELETEMQGFVAFDAKMDDISRSLPDQVEAMYNAVYRKAYPE